MKILDRVKNEEVEWKKLGEVCDIKTGQIISKSIISKNIGVYPVINSGKEPLGYINEYNTENDPIGITTRGAGVGSVTYQEGKYYRGNLNYSVTIKDNNKINNRFLYHTLLERQNEIYKLCTYNGIPALNASELKKLEISIPSLETQEKIVKILDKFQKYASELQHELQHELQNRTKQYEYYRDYLLSEKYLLKKENKIEKFKLSDLVTYGNEKISFNLLNEDNYVGVDNLLKDKMGKEKSQYVPEAGVYTKYNENDILIGNIRPYLRKIWISNQNGGASGDVLVIKIKENYVEKINPKYLYYILSSEDFFEYSTRYSRGGKMPRGDKEKIMEYEIKIPTIKVQSKIVEMLDKFEKIVNNLKEGLPKEIELRQKQYEYYREQLLNFKK